MSIKSGWFGAELRAFREKLRNLSRNLKRKLIRR